MVLRHDRALGALLGMAIGDALGMPVEGWSREHIAERYGTIDRFLPRVFEDGAELSAGEFTDDTEGVLCIVESFTASTGHIDPENILARLEILARGEARRWMNPSTLASLTDENAIDRSRYRVTGDVAARGIPLGLIAIGMPGDGEAYIEKHAATLARMTHDASEAADAIAVVGEAVRSVASGEVTCDHLLETMRSYRHASGLAAELQQIEARIGEGWSFEAIAAAIGLGDDAEQVILTALTAAALSSDFESGVFRTASAGGAADSRGAIAGALLGAQFGTAGLPQALIDGLEGRMYLMLAAPWFYQTIQLKSTFRPSGT